MVIKLRNSYWLETYKKPNVKRKKLIKKTDILIIGAGITGISTAYSLKDIGKKVTVVEALEVGSGVTAYTTAKVTVLHGALLSKIRDLHGIDVANLYFKSQIEAFNLIKNIIKKENIDCDFKHEDAYVYASTDEEVAKLEKEWEILKEIDSNVELVSITPLPKDIIKAIKYKNNATFHPLKYVARLAEIIQEAGVNIYENSRVVDISLEDGNYMVEMECGAVINSEIVVVATHYPIKKFSGLYFTKLIQERSQAVAFKTRKVIPGMYINIKEPIRSYRSINEKTMIMGGCSTDVGESISTNYYEELKKAVSVYDKEATILNEWSTEDCMPVDYVPFIGKYALTTPNLYVATGFQKWGMTNSHVAALTIKRDILELDNLYKELYNPTRFSHLRGIIHFGEYLAKIIDGLVITKLTYPEDIEQSIEIGSGKVINNQDGKNVAIYRTSKDEFLYFKPNCTHLGCGINWNDLDKTWDCKCHGSRFSPDGKVLNDPAYEPLEKFEN